MTRGRRVPLATYRVQLTPSFGFAAAARVVPYLRALGVSDLYLSPIFEARRGSEHGYDVVDPTRLSSERGGERGFRTLERAMERNGMRMIIDLVPHHLAAHETNSWWWDLLRRGRRSPARRRFEADEPSAIVVPILGRPYAEVLARGELRVERRGGEEVLRYHDRTLPIDPASWRPVIGRRSPASADLRAINADGARLDALVRAQNYRPVYWRVANEEVNYRRFFDISDLAGLRVEDAEVFRATHRLALRLARRPAVAGFRIDHIDGLRDPEGYLRRLRRALPDAALYVEKILDPDERLPDAWDTDGTTGYEYLALAGGLAVDPRGYARLRAAHTRFTGIADELDAVVFTAKREALASMFPADVDRVMEALVPVARSDPEGRDLPAGLLRQALVETTVQLPVYRTYARGGALTPSDRARIAAATKRAEDALAPRGGSSLDAGVDARRATRVVRRALLGEAPRRPGELLARWQQLSGPAMAKGFEDTALYRWVPLASANEVGGRPGRPAVAPEEFHAAMRERARRHPHGLSATSTHDTKRGEDLRARLAVLSEMPDAFARAAARWHRATGRYRSVDGPAPDEEWLAYQTILGAWDGGGAAFARRIGEYLVKAAREAKRHTGWLEPDLAHERALRSFVARTLTDRRLVSEFDAFAGRLAWHGAIGSLAQAVLRTTAPGVPDLYQGSETWNLSLVDPDNRRPVPFARLHAALDRIDRSRSVGPLLRGWRDGRVKLFVTSRALRVRAEHAEAFRDGAYLPLDARGPRARHVVAFARRRRGAWILAVVPRLTVALAGGRRGWNDPLRIPAAAWGSTELILPRGTPARWRDGFTGRGVDATSGRLSVSEILDAFPVALLIASPRRSSGR